MNDDNHNDLWERRYEIKERALLNRMYQQERRRFYEGREGFIKAVSILAGSIAFANVADPAIIKWCAAFITGFSTASLVFGFGEKARDSVKRSAEWTQLERDIEADVRHGSGGGCRTSRMVKCGSCSQCQRGVLHRLRKA